MSPAAFCYRLTERARAAEKRIVLPEGDEPRTIRAAALCAQRNIARCVLLGNAEEIQRVAAGLEVELPTNLEILDPSLLRANYVDAARGDAQTQGTHSRKTPPNFSTTMSGWAR